MRGRYVLSRVAAAIFTVYVAVTINFLLFRAAPGDAVSNISRLPNATPAVKRSLREQFGLDDSKWEQYLAYMKQLAQGNLGRSFSDGAPVTTHLWHGLANTVPMVLLATVLAIVAGWLIGLVASWRRGSATDNVTVLGSLWFYSMPSQFLGIGLIFLVGGLLPSGGLEDPFLRYTNPGFWPHLLDLAKHAVLPVVTLGLAICGQFAVISRSATLETLGEDYILTARAKGLTQWATVRRHAARNALLPIWTLIALSLGSVVGGAIIVETVFSWPGVGLATFQAVADRDYPLLQGTFLLLTISVIFANLLADLLYVKLDPRVVVQ